MEPWKAICATGCLGSITTTSIFISMVRTYISFSNKRIACGFLDVDMNAGSGRTREPVENIVIPNLKLLKPGAHRLLVHQFSQRENIDYGFEVEVDLLGQVTTFKYDAVVKGSVVVAEFLVDANTT